MPDGSRLSPEARLTMLSGVIAEKVQQVNAYRVEDLGYGHVWDARSRVLREIRDLADELQEVSDALSDEPFADGMCDFRYEMAVSNALDAMP